MIPFYITKVPVPHESHKCEDLSKPVRVCDCCFERLENLANIANHVGVSEGSNTSLELHDLQRLADPKVTRDSLTRQWANFQLSSFRDMHYFLPGHVFSNQEREMLWVNRHHFVGHNTWFVQFLKSVDFIMASPAVLTEIDQLLADYTDPHRVAHTRCWDLMCTRTCQCDLTVEHAIQLLNQKIRHNPVRRFALSYLEHCDEHELKCLIPYLVRHSLYAPVVQAWLFRKCARSETIANEVFWEFQTYLDSTHPQIVHLTPPSPSRGAERGAGRTGHSVQPSHVHQVILEAMVEWKRIVPDAVRQKISDGVDFVQALRSGYNGPHGAEGVAKKFASLQKIAFHTPTNLSKRSARVDYQRIDVKGSYTAPVAIHFSPVDGAATLGPQLWKPVDIRKEQIIMNTVRMMKIVLLQDENLHLPIVDYNIRPTSARDGLIEMVPACISLQELRETNTDILPWIIERNETEPAGDLRERFLQSCAAYCVISYLLGIGDRNLHNLLLRPDGSLFHIDFGFVLGQDPKPLDTPKMRITAEMLAALGGLESEAYGRFRELASKIYNCVRRHINLFVVMLRLFIDAEPAIVENGAISEQQLMKEIRRRFAPGENYQEAEIILYNHIEQSTSRTFNYYVIDGLHTWATRSTSTRPPGFSRAVRTANTVLRSLWNVAGLTPSAPKPERDVDDE